MLSMLCKPTLCMSCSGNGSDLTRLCNMKKDEKNEVNWQMYHKDKTHRPILAKVRERFTRPCKACNGLGRTGLFTKGYRAFSTACKPCNGSGRDLQIWTRTEAFHGECCLADQVDSTQSCPCGPVCCSDCGGTGMAGRLGWLISAECKTCSGSGLGKEYLIAVCYLDRVELKFEPTKRTKLSRASLSKAPAIGASSSTAPAIASTQSDPNLQSPKPAGLGQRRISSQTLLGSTDPSGPPDIPRKLGESGGWPSSTLRRRLQVAIPHAPSSGPSTSSNSGTQLSDLSGSGEFLGTISSTNSLRHDFLLGMDSSQRQHDVSHRINSLQRYLEQAFRYRECRETGNRCKKRYILYHGTDAKRAAAIENQGFQITTDGIFGPAVYVTGDPIKAAAIAEKRAQRHGGTGAVFELSVDVGRCKTYNVASCKGSPIDDCGCRAWLREDYDSQFAPGVKQEEAAIRNAAQICVRGRIY